MSRQVGKGYAVDGRQVRALPQPAQAFAVAAADTDIWQKTPVSMQRCQSVTQRVHAAVGVFAIDHTAAVAKAPARSGALDHRRDPSSRLQWLPPLAVRQLITRTPDDPHPDRAMPSSTDSRRSGVSSKCGDSHRSISESPSALRRVSPRSLEDAAQPTLVGLAHRFEGDVHQ